MRTKAEIWFQQSQIKNWQFIEIIGHTDDGFEAV